MADEDTKRGYSNAFWNVLEPLMNGKQIQGTVEYVAIEVLVGQAIRRIAFGLPYNWMASAETHLYSVPLIGQLNFGDPFTDMKRDSKQAVDLTEEVTNGAKKIPAVLAGYVAHKLRTDGVRIPAFANKEVIALMLGKMISRPLTAYIFSSLPKDAQTALLVINNLFNIQKAQVDQKDEDEDERRR